MTTKVLLCGVGGQGTILGAHILADAAMRAGYDVKVSEIHGMSQRGGAVTTVVTFGEDVKSMVCAEGEADILVSFEIMEAVRNSEFLKSNGSMVVSDEVIKPASVLTGKCEMPKDLKGVLLSSGAAIIPAVSIAKEIGNPKASNVALLGALSKTMDIPIDAWMEAVVAHVPEKTIDVNKLAFSAGREAYEERKGEE